MVFFYPVALVFVMMIHCESRFDFWSHPDTDSDPSECRTLDTDAWHFLCNSRASCIRSQTYRRVAREMQQANRVSKALNKR